MINKSFVEEVRPQFLFGLEQVQGRQAGQKQRLLLFPPQGDSNEETTCRDNDDSRNDDALSAG